MSVKAEITLVILKFSLISSCVIYLSDEDTPSPGERNVLVHVNSMTLSLEQVCAEDIELSEHHSPLTDDCQYNESSGAEWKGSSMTNITTLENIYCHETAEGPFNFDPGRANER